MDIFSQSKMDILSAQHCRYCVSRWGRMCGSPRPFARVVGGCAGAVREVRLTRPSEPVRAAGWRRASIFLLARRQPCRSRRRRLGEKRKGPRGFLGPFSCYSALTCSSVRPVNMTICSMGILPSSIRRAISRALFSSPSSRPSSRA